MPYTLFYILLDILFYIILDTLYRVDILGIVVDILVIVVDILGIVVDILDILVVDILVVDILVIVTIGYKISYLLSYNISIKSYILMVDYRSGVYKDCRHN